MTILTLWILLPVWTLHFLDYFFLIFHTGLSLFNATGWIWRKTRYFNLLSLLVTGLSWFGMGIWYGWGYCFCTDWHWQVRRRLGDSDLPVSYIQFLIQKWTGLHPDPALVDLGTGLVFAIALVSSLFLNYRDMKQSEDS